MIFVPTEFNGLFSIEPDIEKDNFESQYWIFSKEHFEKQGIDFSVTEQRQIRIIDPQSIRGLYYQSPPYGRQILLKAVKGSFFVVAVDLRKTSPTFQNWFGIEINVANNHQLFIPEGFAYGYLTLKPDSEILLQFSKKRVPSSETGIRYDDPKLEIFWMVNNPLVPENDLQFGNLSDIKDFFA